MVVGRGSYLDELIEIAGGRNVFHDLEAPSPVVNVEEIARRDPDVLIASARTSAELLEKPQWQAIRAVRQRRFVLDDPTRTGRPSVVLGMAAASLAREDVAVEIGRADNRDGDVAGRLRERRDGPWRAGHGSQ